LIQLTNLLTWNQIELFPTGANVHLTLTDVQLNIDPTDEDSWTWGTNSTKIQFWIFFIGVNLTFFPQHFSGMAGMPRRIPDYPDAYAGWNYVSSVGAAITMIGTFLFLYIAWKTITSGEKAEANPWGEGATTLEWTVASPAPFHTHEQVPDMTGKAPAE
jgi:heme/copper-type cytochrome/quinol oxidase subunit 1